MSPDKREKAARGPSADTVGGLGAYLTIAGRGLPAGCLFEAKLSALYSVAYAIKLGMGRGGRDFTVVDLEAFWVRVPDGPRTWKLGPRVSAANRTSDLQPRGHGFSEDNLSSHEIRTARGYRHRRR